MGVDIDNNIGCHSALSSYFEPSSTGAWAVWTDRTDWANLALVNDAGEPDKLGLKCEPCLGLRLKLIFFL